MSIRKVVTGTKDEYHSRYIVMKPNVSPPDDHHRLSCLPNPPADHFATKGTLTHCPQVETNKREGGSDEDVLSKERCRAVAKVRMWREGTGLHE